MLELSSLVLQTIVTWHISSTSDCAHTGDVLDRAKEEFAKFRREIESYDLNLEDDETVRRHPVSQMEIS